MNINYYEIVCRASVNKDVYNYEMDTMHIAIRQSQRYHQSINRVYSSPIDELPLPRLISRSTCMQAMARATQFLANEYILRVILQPIKYY